MTMDDKTFAVGDRVYVTCPGLAMLRAVMRQSGHDPEPNHTGTVEEVDGFDGEILICFDQGESSAPYPPEQVKHLTDAGPSL